MTKLRSMPRAVTECMCNCGAQFKFVASFSKKVCLGGSLVFQRGATSHRWTLAASDETMKNIKTYLFLFLLLIQCQRNVDKEAIEAT
jgi:hypothetical protein